LKSIGLAIALYGNDNDGSLLPATAETAPYRAWWWKRILFDEDYLTGSTANINIDTGDDWFWRCPTHAPSYGGARYALNDVGFNIAGVNGWPNLPRNIIQVAQPSRLIAVSDAYNEIHDWSPAFPLGFTYFRHQDQCNIVFLDGHVAGVEEDVITANGVYWDPDEQ